MTLAARAIGDGMMGSQECDRVCSSCHSLSTCHDFWDSASQRFEITGACSMGAFIATARNARLSVLPRTVIFFLFWLILGGTKPADFVVGALAAVAVTCVSLLLLPPSQWRLSPVALARLVLREFVKSAGVKP
jgi:Na+/H+ ion antiporter subunit